VIEGIAKAVPGAIADGDIITVEPDGLLAVAEAAKEAGFEMCIDLTAVDYLHREPRFEVVVNLLSQKHKRRLRIRCGVLATKPVVPSLTDIYPGANFYEREVYDLMGISFTGHPDMTRILMPDDWEGHPLRKDFAVGAVPVQFKSSPTS
jgi:NADH-quinone oxidoreductase subunit C